MRFETVKVADLLSEISMGPFGSNIKVDCFVDSGIPVLNGSNLEGFSLKDNSFRYVTVEKADSLRKANAFKKDIIITHRGTLGQIVFIPENSKYDRYVISQSQFRARCNEKVLPEYLVYYFHTKLGQHKLLANASQVGVPALARATSTFREIEIEIPDIKTQQKIVKLLELFRLKIETNIHINENLLQQVEALFKERFLSQDALPFGWKRMTLGDVSEMSAGGDKPKIISNQKTDACQYPVYSNGISDEGLYGFTTDYKISSESVTVSARGTIGFVCLRHIPYTPIVRLVTLVPRESIISAKYLYLWLKSIPIHGTGTTQQQLTVPDFRKTEIIIPPEADMREFTETVNPLFHQVWSNQDENAKLADVRDALLPRLMSGELDVSALDL